MATEILLKNNTAIVWADPADYNSANSGYARTHQITLAALASAAAREGAKADLGATRAARYAMRVFIEVDVAPTAGTTMDFYWCSSISAVAGTGNDAGATGADAVYKGGEEAEWLVQALYVGSLVLTNDAATTVQRAMVGEFCPPERYGFPIVYNGSGQALEGDDIEMCIAVLPLIDESQ